MDDHLIKLDWAKYLREKYTKTSPRFTIDRKSLSMTDDDDQTMSKIVAHQSTDVSYHLFSPLKSIFHETNLTQQMHQSISTLDCVDWTNHQSKQDSMVNKQLNTMNEITREIRIQACSSMNNNHFHARAKFNENLQFSNNKEKKKKKKNEKEENNKEETEIETKKSKKKVVKIEESVSDSDSAIQSPSSLTPTQTSLKSATSSAETSGFPSLSIPVPHPGGSSSHSFVSPDASRFQIPQQSNSKFAHLSQVQQQLQTDLQNPSFNTMTSPHNTSVQQQLQSLSQMARDGDEILITLSINALTSKQQNPTNPSASQNWSPVRSSPTDMAMPRNLEIVAKGFARAQYEHPPPPLSNPYLQQPSMTYTYNQRPQTYSMPCYSNNGPPQIPIGPPIQPIFPPPPGMMPNGFHQSPEPAEFTTRRRNSSDDCPDCSHRNSALCDSLCQSSFYQPDFRGRPSPGVLLNPYLSHSRVSRNSSAKYQRSSNVNFNDVNRTYSSFYY